MVSATASLSENKKEWKTEIEKVHSMDFHSVVKLAAKVCQKDGWREE